MCYKATVGNKKIITLEKRKDIAMLNVMGKKILIDESKLLYDRAFTTESLKADWEVATGEWWLDNEWLTGRIRENGGGYIYNKGNYSGNIMIDFYGKTVLPCGNDLNFTWHTEGWNFAGNDAGKGYIAGLGGWWEGKTGIEKYPECKIQATTSAFTFEAGKTYHIQAGTLDGLCFIFVDEKLVIEMKDPEPFNSNIYAKVGIGTYCSYIQVKDFKVYELCTEDNFMCYKAQFQEVS